MLSYDFCPICKDELKSTLPEKVDDFINYNKIFIKSCDLKNHKYVLRHSKKEIIYYTLYNLDYIYNFFPKSKKIIIHKNEPRISTMKVRSIPYFEPDFSDVDEVLKKINTYIIFS